MSKDAQKTAAGRMKHLMASFIIGSKPLSSQMAFLAGVASGGVGMAEIAGALGRSQLLEVRDPLIGLPTGDLMLLAGITYLTISFLLLCTAQKVFGLELMALAAFNFIVYRIGLWKMGWHHSSGFDFRPLGASLKTTDMVTSWLAIFLLAGSCLALGLGWRKNQARLSLKISCPACGGRIKFFSQNLGSRLPCPHCQKPITLRPPDAKIKTACFFCQGHIEFPAHAIGQKMPCPHCNKDITLKEPS